MSKDKDFDSKFEFAYECGKNFFYTGLDESYYKVENPNNREEELAAFRMGYNEAKIDAQVSSEEKKNTSMK